MKTKDLVTISMYAALFSVLEYITVTFDVLKLPQGGSISLSIIVLIIASYQLGFKKSLCVAILSFVVKFMIKTPMVVHWIQFLFDYIFAYSAYSIAGLIPNLKVHDLSLPFGVIVSNILRFIIHTISGLLFYAEFYRGNVLLGVVSYNATYMVPTTIISFAFILAILPKMNALLTPRTSIKNRN
ncbi:thiamine transporter [Erysipelothrix rhusiopathiae]|uniref:Thiamine transporter n=1 Tax=Erysipelothrix piscisicarius TaxID=2485784 RepID=A0A3S8RMU6_9FIRM|nr:MULTISPECIES: energy-coupled thiamine transporter ThiT [Erysipelothrix]AZK44163.1 thiamine transporter [Erysipelothrix piscisicarius]MBK2404803.1 thiamine transporter [Erysipelothrix sp. strain 2 (EsS2-7-Brazil)]NBA01938.1 thiamine transporter [Erysipelothrix rhusiopathiae]